MFFFWYWLTRVFLDKGPLNGWLLCEKISAQYQTTCSRPNQNLNLVHITAKSHHHLWLNWKKHKENFLFTFLLPRFFCSKARNWCKVQTWQCADVWVTIHLSNRGLGNSKIRNRVSRVRVRVSLRVLGPGLWLGSVTQTSGDRDTRMTINATTCKACITCQANRQHNMYKQM